MTYVEADEAVVLAPGFLNDHNPKYTWIPYEPDISMPCVLCTHISDTRRPLIRFAELLLEYYRNPDLML